MNRASLIYLLAGLALLATTTVALAAAPRKINYQGYLTNPAGAPLTGSYSMVLSLCDAATAGTCPWSETQSVAVDKGIFNVAIGAVTPLSLPFDIPYYLDIQVNGEQMGSRQPLTSVGYAYTANTATTATNFSGSLSGDVTGTQGTTVVAAVGGTSAVSVASGVAAANSATANNTSNTIVKRDLSGNFFAGTIMANLIGTASTATALAANGTNCPAGQYPLGVDASGNAEGCTAAGGGTATIVSSGGTDQAKNSVNYHSANGHSADSPYPDSRINLVPLACTARNLYATVYHWEAGDSGTYTVTLMLGTSGALTATALTCTVANTGGANTVSSCSDLSNTVSLAAGNIIAIKVDGSSATYNTGSGGGPPKMAWGFICQ